MSGAKFNIPSVEEISNAKTSTQKRLPLFKTHRLDKLDDNQKQPSSTTSSSVSVISSITGSAQNLKNDSGVASVKQFECSTAVGPVGANDVTAVGSLQQAKPSPANAIVVNVRQRSNPILKHVRNVPWVVGETVADYELGRTTCALFLSLRYHQLHSNYIHERLKELGVYYTLRVLLVQVDVKNPYHSLKELAKICLLAEMTMMLAWSTEEAGRYLETYKSFEYKPPDLIKEHTSEDYLAKVTDCLTTVKKVNKTDVMTLLSTFGSLENILKAGEEELSLCSGLGPTKAKKLHSTFSEPFIKAKRKR